MDILKNISVAISLLFIATFTYKVNATDTSAIVVVANYPDSKLKLSQAELRNLFMGTPLDIDLEPFNLPADHISRVMFNTKIIGLTEHRIQSYWAQMRFSGRKQQPKEVSNEQQALEYLINTPKSITYLPSSVAIPNSLQIVLTID